MTLLKLDQRCWFSCVFLLLIDKVPLSVSLQEIEAVVGDTVILPCSNSDKALQGKLTVFWRFRYNSTVYDIINSRESFDEQDASFRGRVESFPAEWTKGNFSITLSSVTRADSGTYTCFIPAGNANTESILTIKEAPVSENRDIRRGPENVLLFSIPLLGLTLLYV
ncbi:CD276 antigen homolog isoform X2 [Colossoma macropomum]|uniref:CD276 antigen homolog isoform X2 n=1 Tax=Colossoma macropomum TaxID=42526 RepID=UPI001864F949|nr:CD276 antigen homolog isoform X2 [Colossoma macropomum]